MSVATQQNQSHGELAVNLSKVNKGSIINTNVSIFLGTIMIILNDLAILYFSLYLSLFTRANILTKIESLFPNQVNLGMFNGLWWLPLICILVIAYEGLYNKRLPYWSEVRLMVKAIVWSAGFATLYLFLSKAAVETSRPVIILYFMFITFLLPLSRYLTKTTILKSGLWAKPVLLLGAGKTAELVLQGFDREFTMGYQPVGVLDDKYGEKYALITEKRVLPLLGKFSDIDKVIQKYKVHDVIIAAPGMKDEELVKLTNYLQHRNANVILIPDLFGIPLAGIQVNYLFDERTLLLSMKNNLASRWNQLLKRCFDIVVGTIAFIFALPIMALISVAIRLDSKGPAVFVQSRLGKDNSRFMCYKFRTMYLNNDEILNEYLNNNPEARIQWEKYAKLKDYDPRITRVGRLLRKTSLDELPQIFNVIKGEMSLVGPRPYLPREIEQMGYHVNIILKSWPGITGLWQVSGRNDIDFNGRLLIDDWYIQNWSLWQDISLLFRTVGVVLLGKGAY